jgi:hypothetical protein
MGQASIVTNDWVVKGCHIHMGAVELAVFPDHKGGVGFRSVFAVTARNRDAINAALNSVVHDCLQDPLVRSRWIRSLRNAIIFMVSFDGEPSTLANGRMVEFKFLIDALERYRE